MKKIILEINEEDYRQISDIVYWKNTQNLLLNKDDEYTVEDFIKGAAISKTEEVTHFTSLLNTSINTNFSNNFKEIAKQKQIRQVDIRKQIGLSKSKLSLIFNNETQPRIDIFIKIWIILGCPPIHKCIHFKD